MSTKPSGAFTAKPETDDESQLHLEISGEIISTTNHSNPKEERPHVVEMDGPDFDSRRRLRL